LPGLHDRSTLHFEKYGLLNVSDHVIELAETLLDQCWINVNDPDRSILAEGCAERRHGTTRAPALKKCRISGAGQNVCASRQNLSLKLRYVLSRRL
jgi:hypothetical protein